MSKAYIAVEGCQFTFSKGTGTVTVNSVASQNVKINKNGVYSNLLSISIAGYTGDVTAGTGTGVITATATQCKVDGSPVLRQGDNVTVTISGNKGSSIGTTTDTVTISSAGQTVIEAE